MAAEVSKRLQELAREYSVELQNHFKENLLAVVLFGSVARNEAQETSDIDLLLVFKTLPKGRMNRQRMVGEYLPGMQAKIKQLSEENIFTDFTCHIKTEGELRTRTPFLYEVVHDGIVLYDSGVFRRIHQDVLNHMQTLGSKWRQFGKYRYLDLKPDYKPGDVFEI